MAGKALTLPRPRDKLGIFDKGEGIMRLSGSFFRGFACGFVFPQVTPAYFSPQARLNSTIPPSEWILKLLKSGPYVYFLDFP